MDTFVTKSFVIVFSIITCLTLSRSLSPCNEYVFYTHDTLFNGKNSKNATSAPVTKDSPLSPKKHFGKMVVFNDPVTEDNHLLSEPVGRAQGFFFYNGKYELNAWSAFTLVFNSTDYKGTLTIMGADIKTEESRDLSVVGGTGDFFMARGFCTVKTDDSDGAFYFRLKLDIKLYECY